MTRPPTEPMTEHDDSAEDAKVMQAVATGAMTTAATVRITPHPLATSTRDLEVRPHAPSQVDDDSAEVERIQWVVRDGYVAAIDRRDSREAWRDAARAVLADLRELYVLVSREGAEVVEDWGVRSPDAGYIGYAVDQDHAARLVATIRPGWTVVRRIDVRGTWQVAE